LFEKNQSRVERKFPADNHCPKIDWLRAVNETLPIFQDPKIRKKNKKSAFDGEVVKA